MPRDIAALMRGIFGLHQWPPSHKLGTLSRHATPLSAADVARRYDFPTVDGSAQTIGILQFRGEFEADDFDRCMKAQNVAPAHPIVKRVDGAAVTHAIETTKDLEAALDAQVIGALAPGARIVIYDAPDDERGFLDAIRTGLFDEEEKPSILSISYGWPEQLWTPAALAVLDDLFVVAALLGIGVFSSSRDNGAELDLDGKPHVPAPASNPFVHACGATAIVATADDDREDAWEKWRRIQRALGPSTLAGRGEAHSRAISYAAESRRTRRFGAARSRLLRLSKRRRTRDGWDERRRTDVGGSNGSHQSTPRCIGRSFRTALVCGAR